MKKFILILSLLVLFSGNQVHSQDWAPDGAEWHYEYVHFWYSGYIRIQVTGDTIIHDTICSVLEKRSVIRNLEFDTTYHRYIGKEFMYSDSDKVYLFANNKFYPVYDFSSTPGDTLIIPQNDDLLEWCNPEGKIVITDTGSAIINGQHLRKIIVQPIEGTHWAIYGEIFETIGPVYSYMLPEPDYACVVDLYEGGRLRCYSDPDFGLYSTEISPECDYLVSVPEHTKMSIEIYPNPCKDILHIKVPNSMIGSDMKIYNPGGQLVLRQQLELLQNSISLSGMKPGIYSLSLSNQVYISNTIVVVK